MPCAGRPRRCTDVEELRKFNREERKRLATKIRELGGKPTRLEFAWEAATILHTLEKARLFPALNALCGDRIHRLRQTNIAHTVDPYGRMRDLEFLEAFMQKCEPGWDWRKQAEDESQIEERAADEERYIQELAQMARDSRSHRNRHELPNRPDPLRLIFLSDRIRPNEPMTWTTLKELKLATALSERTIRQIIESNRPKKSELVLKTPKRFGPRLTRGVIDKFLNRLRDFEIDEKLRSDCIAAAQQLQQTLAMDS
jgi:hypothetical protein